MKYREKLHSIDPPCVPYLGMKCVVFQQMLIYFAGVYLSDLVFIDEGNSDTVGEMVNFTKCVKISAVVREIQQYQQTCYKQECIPLFQVCASSRCIISNYTKRNTLRIFEDFQRRQVTIFLSKLSLAQQIIRRRSLEMLAKLHINT